MKNFFFSISFAFLVISFRVLGANRVSNFMSVTYREDGQLETLIDYEGISAKEITVADKNQSDISLRQITDGRRFIQLIFDRNALKECQYLLRQDEIQTFLSSFEYDDLRNASKIFVENLRAERQLPEPIRKWFDFEKMLRLCRRKRKEFRKEVRRLKEKRIEEIEFEEGYGRPSRRRRSFEVLLPGSKWCGDRNRAKSYTDLGDVFWRTDKCCRTHDFCTTDIPGFTFKHDYFNVRPFTISHCKCDDRSRRDLSDLLRVPGTKWCGKGFSARRYTDVGMFSATDSCCRKHDLACPFWIGGFETKYGVHNSMINTLMHCSCDERFRACLKRVGTVDANLVGNIFFNFVQRECFTLEPRKVCNRKYAEHEKRNRGPFAKRKKNPLNVRRKKRNEKKCKRKNAPRKAVIRRNLVY